MIAELFRTLCRSSPTVRKFLWKHWYEFQGNYYTKTDWSFMNYGYASLNPKQEMLSLCQDDEPNRYAIQLYHFLAAQSGLLGSFDRMAILEIGSGRGGGCDYINRYLSPGCIVGLDFSLSAVAFCNQNFSSSNLVFLPGDAEALPFVNNHFDLVINVESSHCYRSIEISLKEVERVLKTGGHFLCADLRRSDEISALQKSMHNTGMCFLNEVDITANVVEALTLDHNRKLDHIQRSSPRLMINPVKELAGLRGSKIYREFQYQKVKYLCFMLKKT